jgi:aspartate/methionine/tyrosine aminotransferase
MTPFSRRLPSVLDDNPLARALAARRAEGRPIFDLTLANPTQAGFAYPTAEIAQALGAGAAQIYEPTPRGLLSARQAIAGYYAAQHTSYPAAQAVDPARLHLTASTSEAYSLLFKLLGDPGAEILAPAPSYPLIEHLAALDGWHAKPYPLEYVETRRCAEGSAPHFSNQIEGTPDSTKCPPAQGSNWRLNMEALTATVTPATRAIAVIHPHNPTGWLMRGGEVAHALLELCEARGLALIADEVFLNYPAQAHRNFARSFAVHEVSALTFTLGGLSKSCGLPHLKLGWIHVGGPATLVAQAQSRLDFIADAYLSVSTPVQAATGELLRMGSGIRAQIHARVEENFAILTALKWPTGFQVLPREAGWCALLRRPAAANEESLARQLLEHAGVLAHPGYFFDFPDPGWHVISLLPEPETFRAAMTALREWLPKLA